MIVQHFRFAAAVAVAASLVLPAFAQAPSESLSDAELLALFKKQVESTEAARNGATRSILGDTRGIKVFVVEPDPEVAAKPAVPTDGAVVSSGPEVTPQPLAQEVEVASTDAPATYTQFVEEMQVNMQIKFDYDSASLRPDQKPKLEQLCRVIAASDQGRFQIVGHTDASGGEAYNKRLSRLRAEEVERYFVEQCGVPSARLKAIGVGEQFLLNRDDVNAPENRRVEFQALS